MKIKQNKEFAVYNKKKIVWKIFRSETLSKLLKIKLDFFRINKN